MYCINEKKSRYNIMPHICDLKNYKMCISTQSCLYIIMIPRVHHYYQLSFAIVPRKLTSYDLDQTTILLRIS